jgi:Arc/MetJ family transcription regulator
MQNTILVDANNLAASTFQEAAVNGDRAAFKHALRHLYILYQRMEAQ